MYRTETGRSRMIDTTKFHLSPAGTLPDPRILGGTVVIADDRLYALGNTDDDRKQDRICLHDNAACRKRYVLPIYGKGPVISQ